MNDEPSSTLHLPQDSNNSPDHASSPPSSEAAAANAPSHGTRQQTKDYMKTHKRRFLDLLIRQLDIMIYFLYYMELAPPSSDPL
ncbi:hypothetical protein Q9189_002739 [Teloschistes chrysophthalmus]